MVNGLSNENDIKLVELWDSSDNAFKKWLEETFCGTLANIKIASKDYKLCIKDVTEYSYYIENDCLYLEMCLGIYSKSEYYYTSRYPRYEYHWFASVSTCVNITDATAEYVDIDDCISSLDGYYYESLVDIIYAYLANYDYYEE
jgi:hypothetical protein